MKTRIILAILAAIPTCQGALINLNYPDNILTTAVTNSNDADWGQFNRDFNNLYDGQLNDSTDGNENVMIPSVTTAITLNLDASYNLTSLQAYVSGIGPGLNDRHTSSVQFEVSTNNGSSWTDLGTVNSGSFTLSPETTVFNVAEVVGSFDNVNALRYTIVSAGDPNNARVGELLAIGALSVPEPSTALLGGLGMLTLLMRRRRCD